MADLAFVGIQFCSECNNMLYPKEDEKAKKLMYVCRNCGFRKLAKNNCIYVNKIMNEIDELRHINTDVIHDPTLRVTDEHSCPKCKISLAVVIQGRRRTGEEEPMRLYYVCKICRHKWTQK